MRASLLVRSGLCQPAVGEELAPGSSPTLQGLWGWPVSGRAGVDPCLEGAWVQAWGRRGYPRVTLVTTMRAAPTQGCSAHGESLGRAGGPWAPC